MTLGTPVALKSSKIRIQDTQPIAAVRGPNGNLFLRDLPTANTKRWVIRRKAEVVAAIRGGLLSRDEALSRYSLTEKELTHWESLIDTGGGSNPPRDANSRYCPRNGIGGKYVGVCLGG